MVALLDPIIEPRINTAERESSALVSQRTRMESTHARVL